MTFLKEDDFKAVDNVLALAESEDWRQSQDAGKRLAWAVIANFINERAELLQLIARYSHTLTTTHGLNVLDKEHPNGYRIDNNAELDAIMNTVDIAGIVVEPLEHATDWKAVATMMRKHPTI